MRCVLVLVCMSVLNAQIRDLATTGDGGQTYFSTSYRLKGSDQPGHLKIFRIAENGLELFRQIELTAGPGVDTNFYLAERSSVSFDGRVVAYTAARNCYGGSHCVGFLYYQGWLARAGVPDVNLSTGALTLSSNGRYVLAFNRAGMPFSRPPLIRYDLSGDRASELDGYWIVGAGRQVVADDGTVLVSDNNGPALWNGEVKRLSLASTPVDTRLDASAAAVVYEAVSGSVCELHGYDVASAQDRVLATTSSDQAGIRPCFRAVVTRYGESVMYLLDGQVYIQGASGGSPRRLTSAPEGIAEATISGLGNVAYAATTTGRLLRIEVASGEQTELVAAPPHLDVPATGIAPGARLTVEAANASSDPALITDAGFAPIIDRTPAGVIFQIPWEASEGSTAKVFVPDNPSQFEEVHDAKLSAAAPVFYTLPAPENEYPKLALAAHEDFSAIVTDDNAARSGEIVHLYLTGLGAVAPAIQSGEAAPEGTLYHALQAFSCELRQGTQTAPAEILFAGLAPGFVGVNQVDMRIPSGFASGRSMMDCASVLPLGAVSAFAAIPVAP